MSKRMTRGNRWVELHRSPRYDVWVGNTQVVDPSYYGLACMAMWDAVLGRPMIELDGQAAGDVVDAVDAAAATLRAYRPTRDVTTAARALVWMGRLCSVHPAAMVRIRVRDTVSDLELVAGVLAGQVTRDEAVRVARERGGTEQDARRMLDFAHAVLRQEDTDPLGRGEPGRRLAVVPCGRAKLPCAAPARQLYTGHHFRYVLDRVEQAAADGRTALVRILSGRHGLLDPDTVVEPYDLTMNDPGSIPASQLAGQLELLTAEVGVAITTFLPSAYLARLRAAVDLLSRPVPVLDAFASCRGIGDQRHVVATLADQVIPAR